MRQRLVDLRQGSLASLYALLLTCAVKASPLIVVGYYPAWVQRSFPPQAIDFASVTHVAHAFAWPTADGNMAMYGEFDAYGFVAVVHGADRKAILSLGGWGQSDGFSPMTADPAKRARFTTAVRDLCLSAGYDGVDIDWEYPSATDRLNLTTWVKELRQALNTLVPPRSLSAAVPAGAWAGSRYDFAALHPHLDWIGCMTYDFHGSWTAHAGHNAPLYSSGNDPCGSAHEAAVYLLSCGLPRQKVLIGIPLYGRLFTAARLYGPSTGGAEVWYSVVTSDYLPTWRYHWDEIAKVPYLTNAGGTMLLSFDDTSSVRLKCAYVREQRLGGVIVWALGQDVVGGEQVLMSTIGRELLSGTVVTEQKEAQKNAELRCFPYPCTNWVTVVHRTPATQAVSVRLCDMRGRTVCELLTPSSQSEGHATFDLSGLASGLYVCQVLGESMIGTCKVLIVR
ncbi:MAG: glycosyl hydrolase family 18 protein [candidate division KSB1 bacterium]|nr:glycosyl hydrolase family 18 protein [candidate division KSB1 bacterium]